MRMGYCYSRDSAKPPNLRLRLFVEKTDAIPQQISFGGFYEKCALTNGKARLGIDREFPGFFFFSDFILMRLMQFVESRPLLPI